MCLMYVISILNIFDVEALLRAKWAEEASEYYMEYILHANDLALVGKVSQGLRRSW